MGAFGAIEQRNRNYAWVATVVWPLSVKRRRNKGRQTKVHKSTKAVRGYPCSVQILRGLYVGISTELTKIAIFASKIQIRSDCSSANLYHNPATFAIPQCAVGQVPGQRRL